MEKARVIMICNNRFGLATIQQLVFFGQLAALVIPENNEALAEEVHAGMPPGQAPVIRVNARDHEKKIIEAIENYQPNLGFVFAFGHKIPPSIYLKPVHGFFNFHPGPLPGYRGADPVFYQVLNREKKVTLTVHRLDEGFDSGPVVMAESIPLHPTDTHGMVMNNLSVVAAKLSGTILKLVEMGQTIYAMPQDETAAVLFPRQKAAEVTIDWDAVNASQLQALVNACNPWNKGAVARIRDRIVRILHTEKDPAGGASAAPGTVIRGDENSFTVALTGNEAARISMVYTEEGFFTGSSFLKTCIRVGDKFQKN